MLLGGLWHGASWTFVLWGAMHGAALIANHLWRERAPAPAQRVLGWGPLAWLLTFLLVCLAWVLFRPTGCRTGDRAVPGDGRAERDRAGKPFAGVDVPYKTDRVLPPAFWSRC
jgi:hypothetical protein